MGHLVDTDSSDYEDANSYDAPNQASSDDCIPEISDSVTDDEMDSQFLRAINENSSLNEDSYQQTIIKKLNQLEEDDVSGYNKVKNDPVEHLQKRIDKYWGYDWYKLHPKLKVVDNLQILKKSMNSIYGRQTILISMGIQYYEHNFKYLTEIGLSIYDPRGQQLMMTPNSLNIHIKIDDNQDLQNKNFIPNKSAYFNGKTSLLLNLDESLDLVQGLLDFYLSIDDWPCSIIGHSLNSIIKKLEFQGVKFPENIDHYDTKEIFLLSGDEYTDHSLMNALKVVNLPYAHLRNAGNDAYYTFLLATKLCDPDSREYYRLDDWQPEIVTDGGPVGKRKNSDKAIVIECRGALEAIDIVMGHDK